MDLKIGAVAKKTGLSPSGIRFLEEQGLLSPSGGRKGSYRSFSLADVSTLLDYRNYRKCGFTQEQISTIMKSEDNRVEAALFSERCSELEEEISQSMRLLQFLRRRSADVARIQDAGHFWEIAERPAMVWMPVRTSNGSFSDWPEDTSGLDLPYTDSVLLFDRQAFLQDGAAPSSRIGIGMLEMDALHVCFADRAEMQYLPPHRALHLIVEITDAFLLGEKSLALCRSALSEHAAAGTRAGALFAVSKRIVSIKKDGRFCRYDNLWIDLPV